MMEDINNLKIGEAKKREIIIRVNSLYKYYKVGSQYVHALDGLDFTIKKGEFCAIVGPSGSGKSTLLNMLAGLEKPSKGEIIIAGRHIEKLNENQLVAFRRENVGFIFQSYNLLQTMSAVENVAMPLMFRGVNLKKRLSIANKYLKLVGLEKQARQKGNAMSGGQQQRVGIARALAMNPKIIFADEPTGNLDTKTTGEVLELMREVAGKEEKTLIMVTHDNTIADFADRKIRIVDGKIN
jgi:ABC transporter related protein